MSPSGSGSTGRRWRTENRAAFRDTVAAAAQALDVQPLAVEKDYWVCQVLRCLVTRFPNEIVFKGGTSLEKLRLIQRFSEDLDLLVIGEFGDVATAKRALRAMCEAAAQCVDGRCTTAQMPAPRSRRSSTGSTPTHTCWISPTAGEAERGGAAGY